LNGVIAVSVTVFFSGYPSSRSRVIDPVHAQVRLGLGVLMRAPDTEFVRRHAISATGVAIAGKMDVANRPRNGNE
jgi:hypothetical protein